MCIPEILRILCVLISLVMNWMRFVDSFLRQGQTISSLEQVDIFPVREFAQTDAALLRAKRAISKVRKQTPHSVNCWSVLKTTLVSCPT